MEDFDDSAMDTGNESVDMSNDSFDTDGTDFDDIPDVSDDSGSDFDDIPEGVDDSGSDFDEIPEGSDDSESDISDVPDDSEMSISELYEQGQREMLEAQQEAEDWADAHDVNAWSDGSMREGHESDDYFRSSLDADQTEMDGLQEQADYYNHHK
ncbi:MAG: hypothetical protein ACI4TD_03120 [Phocaeicola sp.]